MNAFFFELAQFGYHWLYRWLIAFSAILALINVPLALILTHWWDAFTSAGAAATLLVTFSMSLDGDRRRSQLRGGVR